MRLEAFILDSYGPFLRQELNFDPRPGRINLLLAPNEAGKSVLREAVGDLLFEIPERSPMAWLHGTQNMRLTAQVRDEGGEFLLVRRKGRGNTLSDGAAPVPPEVVRRLLGSADRQLFEDLFALDSDLLRNGGLDLCHSSGRLGAMLLAGSGGLGRVQHLLDDLVEQRDALGRAERSHKARPLWRANNEAIEADRALARAALRPEAYVALEKRATEAAEALTSLREERALVDAEHARLAAVRVVRPWLERRNAARVVLADAGEVPRLEPGFEARWRRALEAHAAAVSAAAEAAQQAEAAAAALDGEPPDGALIGAADAIEAVLKQAPVADLAASQLPEIEEKARLAAAEAARLRGELGWDGAVPVPPMPAVRAARERIAALAGLRKAMETADHESVIAHNALRRARDELTALPGTEDVGALAALAREVRSAGLPVRQEAARRAGLDAAAQLERALARLPGLPTREALAATEAPAAARLAEREASLLAAEDARRQALRERDRLADELAAKRTALEALRLTAALPDPGALAAARERRDSLWDAIVAGDKGYVAFERALRGADAVADALLHHAAEATQAETLRREIASHEERLAAAEAGCATATAALTAARLDLSAIARAAGASEAITPADLREVLGWREAALDRAVALDRAREEERLALAALAATRQRLAATLGTDGELPTLLEMAEARVTAAREAAAARKAAEIRERDTAHTVAERDKAAERARAALAEWLDQWRAAVAGLARQPDEPPEATGAALALVDELRGQEADAAALGPRVRAMQAAVDGFARRMAALCESVAVGLASLPPQQAASRLAALLKDERAEAARRQALVEAHGKACAAAAARRTAARDAAAALAALRSALLAEDDEGAEAQLRRIARVAEASAALEEARGHILAQGDGRPEPELEALAASSTAEADSAEIARLEARQPELAARLEAASAEARSAAEARDRAGEGEDAVAAAARREAALAELSRHAEDALVLHAAASLLRAAVDGERAEAGAGTLTRISTVFHALTLGAHAGVTVEERGNDQAMVALEADGRGRKEIGEAGSRSALSEGARDQLFLALRLVALEDYARSNPALPFIADDVLQTFDDARATAALRALLDLSVHVQVIVLTHHPHVQALARSLPEGAVHTVMLAA